MTLKQTKQSGFTIVELLIVIVIIAILAAITIIAYNGIQARAKTSAAAALANNVANKAQAYNTLNAGYPTTLTAFKAGTNEAALDTATAAAITLTAPTDQTTVEFETCASGAGVAIVYYDSVNKVTSTINVGTATTCTVPAS